MVWQFVVRGFVASFVVAAVGLGGLVSAQAGVSYVPFADARPILEAIQPQLWPAALQGLSPAAAEARWSGWVVREDAVIRARVQEGDDDSVINFLLFGTSFTKQPRVTEHELAGVVVRQRDTGATTFVPSPLLEGRIDDFIASVASPGPNERLQFAREVIARQGLDAATGAGKMRLRRYLEDRAAVVGSAVHASTLLDPNTPLVDQVSIFRDRGLSSDTSITIDFGIDRALAAMKTDASIATGAIRRVAIVGPGLDFTDKQEGHDFYPPQTIQPFAVIDSLTRHGLAAASGVEVTAFDLSPRVLGHLENARAHARRGAPYTLVLPRELDRSWSRDLMAYWQQFGDRIGQPATVASPPPSAGNVAVRAVTVRPPVVLSITPRDLNIVLQRGEPLAAPFDLIVATNILLYYDVFEQSLAVANIAKMLRPGGLFLTNDRLFDLPSSPLRPVGATDASYFEQPGASVKGDRLTWYRR